MRTLLLLLLTWAVKLGVVSYAALYPLRGRLWRLAHFIDAAELYSIANSNLDVWLLTLAHTAVLVALLLHVRAPARLYSGLVAALPPYSQVCVVPFKGGRGRLTLVHTCSCPPQDLTVSAAALLLRSAPRWLTA